MSLSIVNAILAKLIFVALHIGNHGSFPPPLKPSVEKEYLEKMKQGDTQARNKLIEHNLRLVAHIMKKYYSANSDQEDLLSIGTIGLIKGINSFDQDKGTRLATYAAKCIDNEILMHFRNMKKSAQDVSMNEPIESDSEGNPLTLMDIIQVDDEIVENLNLQIDIRRIRAYVDEIKNERDREIIKMRYGMDTDHPKTQREVAKEMDISRSYVSRIEKRVLNQLKKRLEQERGI
ncbi:MAG: RNA polymerase sporulation sigma factor SigK [Oscillospiraceae bacterium]|jgi:RNA polymerase sporulation-specific sigma factor|nr:RNA polymerase sporulation sigma factor SigK [Oscillospiraceae bacterium]